MADKINKEQNTQDSRSRLLKEFGERLKELRTKNNLNQSDFGKKVELSPQQISEYEKGKKAPLIDTVMRISEVYGCSMDWLCRGKEKNLEVLSYEELFDVLGKIEFFFDCLSGNDFKIEEICKEGHYPDTYEEFVWHTGEYCFSSSDEYFQKYLKNMKNVRKMLDEDQIQIDIYEIVRKGIVQKILSDIEKENKSKELSIPPENLPFY